MRGLGLGALDGGKAVSLLCDALPRITSLRHLSLIGNRLNVEHVTSLVAAAAGLRELHVDLRHTPAYPLAVHLPTGWLLDLGPEAGDEGGLLVAAGTPAHVATVEESRTGRFLAEVLGEDPVYLRQARATA
jgi:hypothetical protein